MVARLPGVAVVLGIFRSFSAIRQTKERQTLWWRSGALFTKMSAVHNHAGNESDSNMDEKQKARAFMRERFLRVMTGIMGQRCDFAMHEKTQVTAEIRACDRDVMHLCVTKLETPIGIMPQTVLRTGDILSIHVPHIPVATS